MCVGGPALVYYVMPTEEELFLVGVLQSLSDCPLTLIRNITLTSKDDLWRIGIRNKKTLTNS
jgi:hypothetical protein